MTLADHAKLRNALVHQYEKVEVPELFDPLSASQTAWKEYVAAIYECLKSPPGPP